ncbi:hypothetical protein QOZ80_9AG0681950 [Eleusine coracana subsp. coracana]|nr:hypothetical protein QOZ80_9AG0681950 [Eleusine coracana subsp. coracana]
MFMCSELYIAAFEGRTQEVTRLLTGSDDVAIEAARNGQAALHATQAYANHPGECCSTSEVTGDRSTLLHIAASQNHCKLIAELAHRDSTLLSSLNTAQETPLHCAARAGHADAVEAIFRLAKDNVEEDRLRGVIGNKNESGDTALHLAARHGHAAVVETLMKLAPELASEVNVAGVSPLYLAVMSGSVHAVAAIVGYKEASAAGPCSQNALHAAVFQSSEMASLLLRWRPALAIDLDNNNSSPLHFASSDVQAHIMNNAGLTPSDAIESSTGFFSMVRLVVKLYAYGAQFRPQRQDQIRKWTGQDIMKWRLATSKNLAIVSTLVATVAFSAAFNVPGSYGSDGKANLNSNRMYNAFLVLDTVALTTAVMATMLLVYGRASRSNRSCYSFDE